MPKIKHAWTSENKDGGKYYIWRKWQEQIMEINIREAFAIKHKELGFSILMSQDIFPDYVLKDKKGKLLRAEAEVFASDFQRHKHDIKKCELIICFKNDWKDCPIKIIEIKVDHFPSIIEEKIYVQRWQQRHGAWRSTDIFKTSRKYKEEIMEFFKKKKSS